jgi:uncharacterized membrane protein YeiB
MSVTSQPQPAKANRIAALDILRGIAILGTLGTNIWVFAAAGTPLVEAFVHTRLTIQGFFEVFCNGKFLSLLSILFGVGVAIQYDAAQRRGREWPGHYLWRSTLLFLEGLFHFTLLFEGDVLMGYAVVAVIVAFLLRYGERLINWVIGLAALLHLLLISAVIAAVGVDPSLAGNDAGFSAYAALLSGDNYLAQIAFRLENMLLLRTDLRPKSKLLEHPHIPPARINAVAIIQPCAPIKVGRVAVVVAEQGARGGVGGGQCYAPFLHRIRPTSRCIIMLSALTRPHLQVHYRTENVC